MPAKLVFLLLISFCSAFSQSGNIKFEHWKQPSFYRGFNIAYDKPWIAQDLWNLKQTGANLVQLGILGFRNSTAPYGIVQDNINQLDSLISFCRQNKLYYTISVREGPGRRDVYYESNSLVPKSTIWKNADEQHYYAMMCREIVSRYENDSLFVGIAPIVEPNPLFDTICVNSKILASKLAQNGIELPKIYSMIIDSIRTVSPDIPVLVQNVAYTAPEYWDLMSKQSDDKVVYEFHFYRPKEFVESLNEMTQTYPGLFFYFPDFNMRWYDKKFIGDTLLAFIHNFQQINKVPVYIGEFGLILKQNNGVGFLKDITDIAFENNWSFAFWAWIKYSSDKGWNYKAFGNDYWSLIIEVLNRNRTDVLDFANENKDITCTKTGDNIIINTSKQVISVEICDYIGNISGKSPVQKSGENTYKLELNNTLMTRSLYFLIINTDSGVFAKKIIID